MPTNYLLLLNEVSICSLQSRHCYKIRLYSLHQDTALSVFKLLFQSDQLVIVDKAPGIGFHDEAEQQGLANQVKQDLGLSELYPVHRLDKMTSGLLIFACTLDAARELGDLFAQHKVEKYYLAISDKKPLKKQGLIKGDMEKARRGSWKLCKSQNNPAITQFFSFSLGQGLRLFLLKPHSGKTHQLRVALKSLAAPIIGDARYHEANKAVDWDRGYLHAYALRFQLMGQDYEFVCKPGSGTAFLTDEVSSQLETLQSPWDLSWPRVKA